MESFQKGIGIKNLEFVITNTNSNRDRRYSRAMAIERPISFGDQMRDGDVVATQSGTLNFALNLNDIRKWLSKCFKPIQTNQTQSRLNGWATSNDQIGGRIGDNLALLS